MPTFHETEQDVVQVKITNPYARDLALNEIVFAEGFVGNVADQDGIAQGAAGYINIDAERLVQTDQVNTGDLPAVGAAVYLDEGTTSAGVLQATGGTGTIFVGVCTAFSSASGSEYIEFKPAYQSGNGALSA